MTEAERKAEFRRLPILSDYLATALQDAQYSEADDACSAEREERDTGTIYTLSDSDFAAAVADVERFLAAPVSDNGASAGELLDLIFYDVGSTYSTAQAGCDLWLTRNGHGAGFWDRGLGKAGDLLTEAAAALGSIDPYFGDDGKFYLS
ncbi:hypothetical protein U1872_06195 [Sphingomonas sp. RB3P16]|uniref:hypothetical protein n=1 Tax=Parasphingomonas frigoris TaxID=3096163 RepID=UPI002FC5C6B2